MTEEVFQPDWHETEEALPLVYLLGKVSLEWNMAEQFQTSLMWSLLGSNAVGMAVTGNLGNRPKQAIIAELLDERPDGLKLRSLVKQTGRNFSALQEARNLLVHSHSIFRGSGKPEWRKATGKGPHGHISVLADEDDLLLIVEQIVELAQAYVGLICYLQATRNGEDYELPNKLSEPIRLRPLEAV